MPHTVLIVTQRDNPFLRRHLDELDVEIIPAATLHDLLDALQHRQHRQPPLAVLIEQHSEEFDLLELVLNIRDVDSRIPIVLLADSPAAASFQPFVTLGCICVYNPADDERSRQTLDEVLQDRLSRISCARQTNHDRTSGQR